MSFHFSNESLNFTNAVWDDGEWVSWAEINRYVEAEAVEADRVIGTTPKERRMSENLEEWPKVEPSPEIWERLMKLIRQAQASLEKDKNIGSQTTCGGDFLFARQRKKLTGHRLL